MSKDLFGELNLEEDPDKDLGFKILGKRIGEVPCLRDSYFYGICTGIFGGFGYFMFTSKVRMASHVTMGVFCISTLSYWTYCRYNYEREAKQAVLLKQFMLDQIAKEGIEDSADPPLVTV